MKSDPVNAVLNPRQLEYFCALFNLQPSEVTANFEGWHKQVLMTKDIVFLFPRSPQYSNGVTQELSLYEEFAHWNCIALPKLIKRVKDKKISYYEFGAVTRLPGEPFSKFQKSLNFEQTLDFLSDLSKVTGGWHNIPISKLPSIVPKTQIEKSKKITPANWSKKILEPSHTKAAVDFMYAFIKKRTPPDLFKQKIGNEEVIKQKWLMTLQELANLNHVLIHADIHEDQVLVAPKTLEITAVLDWETARIDNPVWDFDFGEWGLEIWNHSENFMTLRKKMWQAYLKSRGLKISTNDGLHLFYTLLEFTRLVEQKDKAIIPITKAPFQKSVEMYIERLAKFN